MTTLLNLFYLLPLESIVYCFLLLSLVYLCVHQRFSRFRWFRCGIWGTLMIWTAATLWITIFNRPQSPAHLPELIPFHSYRELFATGNVEMIRTNFMNMALFYPAGLLTASLLPERWLHRRKLLSVGILMALFSLFIEYIQFSCTLGEPEVDDVIHNTIGALCGAMPMVLKDILHPPATQLPFPGNG